CGGGVEGRLHRFRSRPDGRRKGRLYGGGNARSLGYGAPCGRRKMRPLLVLQPHGGAGSGTSGPVQPLRRGPALTKEWKKGRVSAPLLRESVRSGKGGDRAGREGTRCAGG